MASRTFTATEAGLKPVANLLRGELLHPVGRDRGQIVSEYGEMIADVSRKPRPTLWQRFTIALAGHGR